MIRLALPIFLCSVSQASLGDEPERRADFRTFFVTRSLGHERLIPYLKAARPEVVQIGNYGAMFHGFADDPRSTKSPMMLPVAGERAALEFQRKLNAKVRGLGHTVVGHFRLIKVMGDWKEQTGFVEYYNERWPEDLLGPKPHADLKELLQRDAAGEPVQVSRYDKGQLTLCLSSPYARQMLKGMLKCAVDHGVDGVMTNYNYRYDCACPHCQRAFKGWLSKQLNAEQLRARLGVANLNKHTFQSIPARIPGYPDPQTATELDWLAVRWGAEHFKQMFDEIFIEYGRSLKKDLLVGQWNHLSQVSLKEERAFTPIAQWGRDEDYFWYSGGAAFVGKNLSLKERKAGDAWLSCLYVREMCGGKPFVMGKYDGIRLAASMAEGYATGGIGMGRYMRFEDPVGYEVLVRYTNFMHRHRDLYDNAQPFADAALVLPRQTILSRRPEALDAFRDLGQALVERQVLLDVVVDQRLTKERLARYPAVILPRTLALSDTQIEMLCRYATDGGRILSQGQAGSLTEEGQERKPQRLDAIRVPDTEQAIDFIVNKLREIGCTEIDAPWTVRATGYRQPRKMVLHLVNYDRDESRVKGMKGPALERPKPVSDITVSFRLPSGTRPESVTMRTPDRNEAIKLNHQLKHDRITFEVTKFDVYAVIVME